MSLSRVKVVNAGSPGGAATTSFYFLVVTSSELTALGALFTAMKPYYSNTLTFQIPAGGDVINDADGTLTGSWTAGSPQNIAGSGSATQSTPTGIEIAWLAAGIVDSHRPIGKTYLIPAGTGAYASNGIIGAAAISAITTAATTFLAAAPSFAIWHRPRKATAGPPAKPFRPGIGVAVSSAVVRSAPAVLRSRRS